MLYTEADAQRFLAGSLGGLAAKLLGKILPCSLSGSYEKIKTDLGCARSVAFGQALSASGCPVAVEIYGNPRGWQRAGDFVLFGLF